jgi:hypothetical protein
MLKSNERATCFPSCLSRRACRGPERCWTCRSRFCRRCPPSPHRASGRTRLHAAFARSSSYSIKSNNHPTYCTMTRLDQGNLHNKLEVPPRTDMSRPGIDPGSPLWEASTLEKSHSGSLLIEIRSIYISARPVENARDSTILFL